MITDFGIFTWFGYALPIEERMRLIRAAGFACVSLWWDEALSEINGPCTKQKELAEAAGLTVENAHLPYFGCDSLWQAGEDGEALTRRYLAGVESAENCGIQTLVLHPFERNIPDGGDFSLYLSRLRRIADACEAGGVRLALENMPDRAGLAQVLEAMQENPCVGLCYDSGHDHIGQAGDFWLLKRFADRLFALHLHDNNGKEDQHLLPGEGSVDWGELMRVLDGTGYSGSFMLEASYPFDLSCETAEYIAPPIPAQEYLAEARSAAAAALQRKKTK